MYYLIIFTKIYLIFSAGLLICSSTLVSTDILLRRKSDRPSFLRKEKIGLQQEKFPNNYF